MYFLDDINRDLLDILQHDGRISYKDLGDRIGLTAPAVAERIRKLEDAGVIKGYRAVVDYEAVGFPILSIIRVNAPMRTAGIDQKIAAIPNVIEANRVTGSDSHVVRARLRRMSDIEELMSDVWEQSDTITNIVTSSPVPRRPMNLRDTNAGRDD
ncbi:Lrp/AsnC family transcriptional regulator [Ilumatobacter sp.]|jgi:Lrp/AsnC family leucine-responsive transcriptional regulator|uniref:Lrp/AsnC family transcriptional regulator n=1 Tax=Ilumatobacter sp. TaxID=1967498 RepID=UPI0037516831